ncbi:ABC transporter permease [Nevskia ramosa]|uniref:ABC transporter permease n=1 Tax=Nevskia ramosa TaxID=64002 RepID=UPI003D09A750
MSDALAVPASAFRFALLRLRRGWTSGELRVLVLALAVAAAAAIAVGLFTDRVRLALESGAGEQLGADAIITGRDPLPEAELAKLREIGVRIVIVTTFPSVVAKVDGEQTQLATIKAVEAGYPLRGALLLSREPYGATEVAPPQPASGEVWVDQRLWTVLGLSLDAGLQVGSSTLRVSRIVAEEPGRSGAFAELAPSLIINADDLAATALGGPGSRLQLSYQLGGTRDQLAAAEALKLPDKFKFTTPENGRPEISNSMNRARSFLNIAVLATILLAAAAVALSARQYSTRLRDEVALLKVLGARRSFIRRVLMLQILLLGLLAGGVGAAIGVAGQAVLTKLAAPVLNIALPAPGWLPLPAVLGLVLLMLAGFALPPVLASVNTAPVRVFQRAADPQRGSVWGLVAAIVAIAALLWLQAGNLKLAGFVLGGALATAGVLALFAWILVRGLAGIRSRGGIAWRFGLGNIARRKGAAVAQIVALGVALMALLLVTVVREDLLATWKNKLPPETPNQFLIGILPEQREPLQAFFKARGVTTLDPVPMVRGRLKAVRGEEVTADSFDDPETRRWINREFNLSWTSRFRDDSEFIDGQPWGEEARGQPWLTVDDYAVERLKLKLGDSITIDFAGTPLTLEVHAVRKIKWDSFKPNFFLVTPPGVLDAEGLNPPLQWIASFYLPRDQRALLRELIREFPNVTALDLDAALNQVRTIVDRIVGALEFIFLFTLLAGLIVMLAVIEGSRADRVRETGVLRALGASARTIRQGLIAEYLVLGGLAGAVAAFAAQALAWVLAARVLELPYGPRPLLWLAGTVAGALIVAAAGYLSLRKVLQTSPRSVLAGGNA